MSVMPGMGRGGGWVRRARAVGEAGPSTGAGAAGRRAPEPGSVGTGAGPGRPAALSGGPGQAGPGARPGRAGGGAGRGGAAPVSLSFPGGGGGWGRSGAQVARAGRAAVPGAARRWGRGSAGGGRGCAGAGEGPARRGGDQGRGPAPRGGGSCCRGSGAPRRGGVGPGCPRPLCAGMAGRTVRVGGLPADLPPDRVADKLTIHFLRSRNGGGEIADVQVLAGSQACALITFEALEGNGREGPRLAPRLGTARGLCPLPSTLPRPPLSSCPGLPGLPCPPPRVPARSGQGRSCCSPARGWAGAGA